MGERGLRKPHFHQPTANPVIRDATDDRRFGERVSIQRNLPRWIASAFVEKAIKFVKKLK
jgi:hypothetical protein